MYAQIYKFWYSQVSISGNTGSTSAIDASLLQVTYTFRLSYHLEFGTYLKLISKMLIFHTEGIYVSECEYLILFDGCSLEFV